MTNMTSINTFIRNFIGNGNTISINMKYFNEKFIRTD